MRLVLLKSLGGSLARLIRLLLIFITHDILSNLRVEKLKDILLNSDWTTRLMISGELHEELYSDFEKALVIREKLFGHEDAEVMNLKDIMMIYLFGMGEHVEALHLWGRFLIFI
jgi:hypothetical protein